MGTPKIKICEECGRFYKTIMDKQRYCSRKCRIIAVRNGRDEQICWKCQKATGGCSWSAFLEPVEGWKANKIIRNNGEPDTYKILSCPLYTPDPPRKRRK